MSTREDGTSLTIWRVASRPVSCGRAMSITTTSGLRVLASRTACRPVSASPTISMSRSVCNRARSPCRTTVWSSAISTVIFVMASPARSEKFGTFIPARWRGLAGARVLAAIERHLHCNGCSFAGRSFDRKLAVDQAYPLPHAQQAQLLFPFGGPPLINRKALAVIFDSHLDAVLDGRRLT